MKGLTLKALVSNGTDNLVAQARMNPTIRS
jgi:hypothetical protein